MRIACLAGSLAGTLTVFTALAAAPLSPVAPLQQPERNANAAPAASGDALMFYSAGLDAMFVDPRDAGLVRALKMIDERVLELPRELEQEDIPAPAIQLALQLLTSPMTLRGGLLEMNGQRQGPPFYAQLSFHGSAETTAELAGRVSGLLEEMGAPPPEAAPNMPGVQMVDADGVPLYFGPMKAADGGSAFVVALNEIDPPDAKIDATGLPEGVKPAMAFMFDAQKLQPIIEMGIAQAGGDPQAEMVKKQLEMYGLYGPNAAKIWVVSGYGKDRSHTFMRYTNYRKAMEAGGMLPEGALSAEDLKRVPADATVAQISRLNLPGMFEMFKTMAEEQMRAQGQEMQDPYELIEQVSGIHPQRDILDHLGQTMGVYMSDSTGGGGLTSLVAFMQVKNTEALGQTIARLRGKANQIAQQQAKGYVRIAEADVGGQKVMTVVFPGLPVPLEICWGMADGYMFIAASPHALQAAMAQSKSGKSLLDNPRFKEMGGSDIKDAIQIQFMDTPRLVGNGYGLVSLSVAALANAVRSPTDRKRDPGMIMPAYHDLLKDAKAAVMISRLEGDDVVMTVQGDRSILVNACGFVGTLGGVGGAATVGALAAGVMSPALTRVGQARIHARNVRSMANLKQIGVAYHTYAAEWKDAFPTTRDRVLEYFAGEELLLSSPLGPAPDGPDYWLNLQGGTFSKIHHPDRHILAYDRAMYAAGKTVAVVFADGHVEQIALDAFHQLTQDPQHEGLDFDLHDDAAE